MAAGERIRWGILGTGRIAARFAEGLASLPEAELWAVGSRAEDSARAFAAQTGAARAYGSYQALVDDPALDVVYVASPHSHHLEHTLLALEAGKAVLCEKPLALDAGQAQQMIQRARDHQRFLMEAMWTRFFPLVREALDLIGSGAIGALRIAAADLGIHRTPQSRPRLFDRALGGGALLDVGVYPVSLATWLFGQPASVVSTVHIGPHAVDETVAAILGYEQGQLASLYGAITTETPKEAHLLGEAGSIAIHANFVCPTRLTLRQDGRPARTIERALTGNGMNYEAEEVMRCLRAGRFESAIMPLDDSLAAMQTLDRIRAGWSPTGAA